MCCAKDFDEPPGLEWSRLMFQLDQRWLKRIIKEHKEAVALRLEELNDALIGWTN